MDQDKSKAINPNDAEIWSNLYRIHTHEFDTDGYLVFADCEQSALDELVDHLKKSGQHEGLFYTREEEDQEEKDGNELVRAGNEGTAINFADSLRIIDLTGTDEHKTIKETIARENTIAELRETRQALENEYKVIDGRITSPGKFEQEMIYAPWLYDLALNGGSSETHADGSDVFELEDLDRLVFPELGQSKYALVTYSDQGFVYVSLHDEEPEDEGTDEEDEDQENDEPSEPEEGDITTEDHLHFYQYGKLYLEVPATAINPVTKLEYEPSYKRRLKAKMDQDQFWPNVWFISDHGNAHLMDLK
jgi:hypothetical protein